MKKRSVLHALVVVGSFALGALIAIPQARAEGVGLVRAVCESLMKQKGVLNASGAYVAGGNETLAQTLALGNWTGANDIKVSPGQTLRGYNTFVDADNYSGYRFAIDSGTLELQTFSIGSESASPPNILLRSGSGFRFQSESSFEFGDGNWTPFSISAATGTISLGGSAGTAGQVLTSQGAGAAPTWTASAGPTARFKAYVNTDQAVANNSVTLITFGASDVEQYKSGLTHSTASNQGRVVVVTAGRYDAKASIQWPTNGTGVRSVIIEHRNSSDALVDSVEQDTMASTSTTPTCVGAATTFDASVGDYFQMKAYQVSGGSLTPAKGVGTTWIAITQAQ
jgi:hypothetical protein